MTRGSLPRRSRRRRPALLLALAGLLIAACADGDGGESDTVLVYAAASLTDAFIDLEIEFESANNDVDVRLNFAGSSTLREQVLEGAPADVFASANIAVMTELVEAGAARRPADFASNRLEIAVPVGNPEGVTGLNDFADQTLLVGVCAVGVPCGDLSRIVLGNAGVDLAADTHEPDVRSLLTKIEAGELDAGLVYRTDVLSQANEVDGLAIPSDVNRSSIYPIATLTEAPNDLDATRFVEFVLSARGRDVLAGHGFDAP
ncbi:MAG: molybdate ABC transporter substrate-binding protein [Acidimicrobiales bacterium]